MDIIVWLYWSVDKTSFEGRETINWGWQGERQKLEKLLASKLLFEMEAIGMRGWQEGVKEVLK